MSKKDHAEFLIRLNLKNEDERRAWDVLQNRGRLSYKERIVEALLADDRQEPISPELLEQIRRIVREELQRLPVAVQQTEEATATSQPEGETGDYDEALQFMETLGFCYHGDIASEGNVISE